MPPFIAALITWSFVAYLLWMDVRTRRTSAALWLPFVWMFIAGTRSLADWLGLGAPSEEAAASTADALAYQLLLAAGVVVLVRRKLDWGQVLSRNKWIWLFFTFGAISIMWAVDPWLAFKRLIKALGNVVMALVIVTDPLGYAAAWVVIRRLCIIALPLSVLFIKYYPEMGRAYHMGSPMFVGVAGQKNGLGQLCLLAGLFACWHLLYGSSRIWVGGPLRIPLEAVLLALSLWVLTMADSATSLACLVMGIALLVVSRIPVMARTPHRIIRVATMATLLLAAADALVGVKDRVLSALGRDADLTTRVPMWEDLMSSVRNTVVGAGFESYWVTDYGYAVSQRWGAVFQAHNGYLELYLHLGVLGLTIFVAGVASGLININRHLPSDRASAMLRFTLLVVVLVYNWTEATFRSASIMWILLMLAVFHTPVPVTVSAAAARPPSAGLRWRGARPSPSVLAPDTGRPSRVPPRRLQPGTARKVSRPKGVR
jgi:exopolysaccharide production protein ExoQ